MQIDFHHAVTYVCARLAGFADGEASLIAYCAQYVDDATKEGEIEFDNGMRFSRISSAHKMLDYANLSDLSNCKAWLPFHFLPGNLGQEAPAAPPVYGKDEFLDRCVCKPNSPVAREMMRAVVERQDRPYALHRLGIAAHVFVDTWAHMEFVGFHHRINSAHSLEAENDGHHAERIQERIQRFFGTALDQIQGLALGELFPLGHGAVLSYPDRPYLRWSYTNGRGEKIVRDNTALFTEAARELFQHFSRYRAFSTHGPEVFTMNFNLPAAFERIPEKLASLVDEDPEARHAQWLDAIGHGDFGFKANPSYHDRGELSWKCEALQTLEDIAESDDPLPFPPAFAASNWKLFHDALQAHRFYILHELLPRYGLLSV
jgi:hypothetical protein